MIHEWIKKIKDKIGQSKVVTRFAPSPTGYLHMGHIGSAVLTYIISKHLQGTLILRIEDHDQSRCRQKYCETITNDLDWLGLKFHKTYRQKENPERYLLAIQNLSHSQRLYHCSCSRKQIKLLSTGVGEELHYSGVCREKGLPDNGNSLRLWINNSSISFEDLRHGKLTQTPADQCGDIVLKDRQKQWTYQFAVVADDIADGVNLVIRGDDLLNSTGRQIMLSKMIKPDSDINYLHHPLINDTDGKKLSKRFLSTSVKQLRAQGYSAEAVIGRALYEMQITPSANPINLADLGEFLNG